MNQALHFEAEPFQGYTEFDELASYEVPTGTGSSTAPAAPVRPTIQTAAAGATWIPKVDSAIRKHFALSGTSLSGRVRLADSKTYPTQFPTSLLPEMLLNLFLESSTSWPIASVIRHHKMDDRIVVRDDKLRRQRVADLQKFIADRVRIGHFEYSVALPSVPSKPTVNVQVLGFSPAELAAEIVAGFTISKPSRADSRVVVALPGDVETLVHEGCHFYAANNFRTEASRHQNEFFIGMRVSQILIEGFCEYFSRQVMKANESILGPSDLLAYTGYVEATGRIVATARESVARDAYFKGAPAAIRRVIASIQANRDAYPLLVPDFVVP